MADPWLGSVLIVEDDVPFAAIVERYLSAHGFATCVASSVKEAVRLLEGGLRPSLILLDINLPGDTGWALLPSRAYEVAGSPSVVVMSAARVASSRLREFGVAGYLPKPFAVDTLLETARRYASGQTSARTPVAGTSGSGPSSTSRRPHPHHELDLDGLLSRPSKP